jgi:hypothetical protein
VRPFVSKTNTAVNINAMSENPLNTKKIPYAWIILSSGKKAFVTIKHAVQETVIAIDTAVDFVSGANNSPSNVYGIDENPIENDMIKPMNEATGSHSSFISCSSYARKYVAIDVKLIHIPADDVNSKNFLPTLSTKNKVMNDENNSTVPMMIVASAEFNSVSDFSNMIWM